MLETKNKIGIEQIIAFLIGFLVCNNIAIIFVVGSTEFNFLFLFNIFAFATLAIKNRKVYINKFNFFDKIFVAFMLFCVFSIINVVVFMPSEHWNIFFKGVVFFTGQTLFTIMNCFFLAKDKSIIIKGLCVGCFVNFVFVIIAYITYNSGNVFTPNMWFPLNEYVYSPSRIFRTQGLFMEPSHFTAFLIVVFPVALAKMKNSLVKTIFMAGILFSLVFSVSGNVPLAIISLAIYIVLRNAKQHEKIKVSPVVIIIVAFILLFGVLFLIFNFSEISEKLLGAFDGGDLTADENSIRSGNMLMGLKSFLENPVGVGFNMAGTKLIMNYPEIRPASTLNYFITLLMEVGFIGLGVYLTFCIKTMYVLVFKGKSMYRAALALAILGVCMVQFGNGYEIIPYMGVVFALAMIETKKIKEEVCAEAA